MTELSYGGSCVWGMHYDVGASMCMLIGDRLARGCKQSVHCSARDSGEQGAYDISVSQSGNDTFYLSLVLKRRRRFTQCKFRSTYATGIFRKVPQHIVAICPANILTESMLGSPVP
jgi:hypothetical protein